MGLASPEPPGAPTSPQLCDQDHISGLLTFRDLSIPMLGASSPRARRENEAVDKAVACAVLLLSSPAIAVRGAASLLRTGHAVHAREVVDADGDTFRLWYFAAENGHSDLLALTAVACGRMRIIGPPPLTREQRAGLTSHEDWRRSAVPGLFSAPRLRHQVGIGYEAAPGGPTEAPTDPPLASLDGLGLVVRSVIATTLSGGTLAPSPEQLRMLDVTIANLTMAQAVDWIFAQVQEERPIGAGQVLCFVNPDCLNISVRDIGYRAVLHRADLVLPDGIGIKLATRMQGVGLRENVNGTDLFPRLCERAAELGTPIYLLGARNGVAAAAAEAMTRRHPGLRIVGTHHGYIAGEEEAVVAEINASGAQILLVAMGVPQQELWIERMRATLRPAVLMGVGGLFDFYSGRIPRAPLWVREIGMEWVWRLLQEPGRMWRRYLIGNPMFLWRVWRGTRGGAPTAVAHAPQGSVRAAAIPSGPQPSDPQRAAVVPSAQAQDDIPSAPTDSPQLTQAVTAQAATSSRAVAAVRAAAARRRAAAAHRRQARI